MGYDIGRHSAMCPNGQTHTNALTPLAMPRPHAVLPYKACCCFTCLLFTYRVPDRQLVARDRAIDKAGESGI